MTGYHIRRVDSGSDETYCLCDLDGNAVPHQITTTLTSSASKLPTFTVEFQAGEFGLQVIDERGDL